MRILKGFFILTLILLFSASTVITRVESRKNNIVDSFVYTVKCGDTLWDIATRYCIASTDDIRELVYDIQQDNAIGNKAIQPGQKLIIKVRKYR